MEQELPLGFAMTLARDEAAMARFEALTQTEKQAVLRQAHTVSSRQEMDCLVASLCRKER